MSDTFDHELDAWEDKLHRDYHGVEGSGSPPNPLFYHMKIHYGDLLEETPRAIKIEYIHDMGWKHLVWLPKSIIKNHNRKKKTLYAHKEIFIACLQRSERRFR